jgi:hypothetical protein
MRTGGEIDALRYYCLAFRYLAVKNLRQPCEKLRDPPRLIRRQFIEPPRIGFVVVGIDVRECLIVGVAHDVTAVYLLGTPWRWEKTGRAAVR